MSSDNPKRRIYSQIATLLRSLGQENRLELLEILGQGIWAVEDLARRSGMSVANASQHLHVLRDAGLVLSSRSGKHVMYRLADSRVNEALCLVRTLAEAHSSEVRATIDKNFLSVDPVEPMSLTEAKARLKTGDIVFLDVRDFEEYERGHIPNALHIPAENLEVMLAHLPTNLEIIAYCRGPYCVLSFKVVEILRRHGFKCRRLQDGFPEWKMVGGPVSQGQVWTAAAASFSA